MFINYGNTIAWPVFMLLAIFIILDLVGFYILFEGVLIPMFLIIGV